MDILPEEKFSNAPVDGVLRENCVALGAEFVSDHRYARFYDRYVEALEGAPGIWFYLRDAALILTRAELAAPPNEHKDWIDAVECFVALLYDDALGAAGLPSADALRALADAAWAQRP